MFESRREVMELNQLRCFRLVAEMENISRAAKLLHISQPSLSQTIRRLEQEMGYPLFRRDGKRIELNRSGEILMEAVARMEEILEQAKRAIEEENGNRHPVVSIHMGCASMLLPDLLRYLREHNPGVQYVIRQWNQGQSGQDVDIHILAGEPETEDQRLLEERICLAIPKNHPLAEKRKIYLHDLKQAEFISLNQDWTLPRIIGSAMEQKGFEPNITMWVDNPNLLRELLKDHIGIAFVPETSWRAFAGEEVRIRPVEDCPMKRTIYMKIERSETGSREQRECAEGIRNFFQKKLEREQEEKEMLQMPMVFGNGMVLQRQKEIAVWGQVTNAPAGTGVVVTLASAYDQQNVYGTQSVTVAVAENGVWKAMLPAGEAECGMTLTVEVQNGNEKITYQDVCIGEVWIAGGQSNMEYLLKYDADREAEIAQEANPDLRFFDYPEVSYEKQWEEFPDADYGFWRKADAENLPWFSAVGYYFAKRLQEKLDVPVAVVGCNWGGTPACAWQDPACLKDTVGEIWLKDYEETVKGLDVSAYEKQVKDALAKASAMKRQPDNPMAAGQERIMYPGFTHEEQQHLMQMMAAGGDMQQPPMGPMHQNRPGGLYETMLKKVAPYTARGVIWYQGESDENHADIYAEVFGSMIQCWRALWKDELPFLFAQLAPFEEWLACLATNYPTVRQQQELVAENVAKTWMASIGDAGMQYDIHPKHKKPVGERMAELALGHVYEKPELCRVPGLCDAPEVESVMRIPVAGEVEKEEVQIKFLHGEGLHLERREYTGIEPFDEVTGIEMIRETENVEIPALKLYAGENLIQADQISIREDTLILTGSFPEEMEIRFAWEGYYEVNLYNKAGIPVKPFRI